MDREYKVFDSETSYEDIVKTLISFGITEQFDCLDNSIFSRNLKNNQAIIFKEINVSLVNAEVFQKQKDNFQNVDQDVKLAKFETIKENIIITDESELSFLSSYDNWGLHKTNVFNTSLTGAGVNVAILDTGFDDGHPDYPSDRNIYKTSFISNSTQDDHGHGMHCTGIACGHMHDNLRYGIAYKSNIYSCKVLDSQKKGFQADVIRGIFWAVYNKCKVINISYGVKNNGKLYDEVFERAVKFAFDNSCIVVAAVGNDSDRDIVGKTPMSLRSPSDCPSAISVSAIDRHNEIYSLGNRASLGYNQTINFTAPGVEIYSSWSRSSVSALKNKVISGTSMAAPFVTGIIALLWQKVPNGHPKHIINSIKTSAFKPIQWDYEDVGYGLIQAPYL